MYQNMDEHAKFSIQINSERRLRVKLLSLNQNLILITIFEITVNYKNSRVLFEFVFR